MWIDGLSINICASDGIRPTISCGVCDFPELAGHIFRCGCLIKSIIPGEPMGCCQKNNFIFFLCRCTQTGVPSPTRQGRRRSGAATTDHGSGPPRTGPEPSRAGPGPLQVEAGPPGGLSHRASQGTWTPRKTLWARPPTPGSGAATCPTGPASGPPLPD